MNMGSGDICSTVTNSTVALAILIGSGFLLLKTTSFLALQTFQIKMQNNWAPSESLQVNHLILEANRVNCDVAIKKSAHESQVQHYREDMLHQVEFLSCVNLSWFGE